MRQNQHAALALKVEKEELGVAVRGAQDCSGSSSLGTLPDKSCSFLSAVQKQVC